VYIQIIERQCVIFSSGYDSSTLVVGAFSASPSLPSHGNGVHIADELHPSLLARVLHRHCDYAKQVFRFFNLTLLLFFLFSFWEKETYVWRV
jgi:hypothetical protein